MSTPQHFSWPLCYLSRTASIWIGLSLFRKERQLSNSCYKTGILASEWLSQRPLSLCLIPAQHRGITTILQCPQEVCAMVGHGQGSDHDPECMAILCLARKRLQSSKAICSKIWGTPASCFRRELTTTILERTAHPTYVWRSISEGRGLSIDECDWHYCVPWPFRDGCMLLFDERNRHSKVFWGHTQRVAYCCLTSVVSIERVFRGHLLRVAYRRSRSAIAT